MKIITCDITKVKEGVIVHQVNNKRVMGAGLAKAIRSAFPQHYGDYLKADLSLGNIVVTKVSDKLYVVGIVGQDGYGRDKQYTVYNAQATGLAKARDLAKLVGKDLFVPYGIGCKLGGGDWSITSRMISQVAPNSILYKL